MYRISPRSDRMRCVWRCTLLLSMTLARAASGQMPTVGAGMLETPDATSPTKSGLWFWGASNLYHHVVGTTTTTEITDPNGFPLTNIRGMIGAPDWSPLNPTGTSTYVWRDQGVFHHIIGGTLTNEITDPNGNPLSNPDGMVWTPNHDPSHPTGTDRWVWTDAALYLHFLGTTSTLVITDPTGFGLSLVRGVVGTPTALPGHATGYDTWIYSPGGTYLHQVGTTSTVEITDANGNPLANVRSVLGTVEINNLAGTGVWFRNGAGAYHHVLGTTTANEITSSGNSITDIRGMITYANGQAAPGSGVVMWNKSGVFVHQVGTLNAIELMGPLGGPIASVRTIVAVPNPTTIPGTDLWIATGANVLFHPIDTPVVTEILDPQGQPILNTRGIVHGADHSVFNPIEYNAFIYTDSRWLVHQVGTGGTSEIIDQFGQSISNIRGMMSTQDLTNVTKSATWAWNGPKVWHHIVGTTEAAEITDTAGLSLGNPWAMIDSRDDTAPTTRSTWTRTQTGVFHQIIGTREANEITDPNGGSIPSPNFNNPFTAQAVVHNVPGKEGGGQGAGVTNTTPPWHVDFAGFGSGDAADVTPQQLVPTGLTTVIAGQGEQFFHGTGGSVLMNEHVAVLMTSAEPVMGGACCDSLGQCGQATALTCVGNYLGDGSGCFGDVNGDGFDDACVPVSPPPGYQEDDGLGEIAIGVRHPAGSSDKHRMVWLNAFPTSCSAGTKITHVSLVFGNVQSGTPVDIYVWTDPTNDGDPSDAVVVSHLLDTAGSTGGNNFNVYDIPDAIIQSDFFFVGALMRHDHVETPATLDTDGSDFPGNFFDPTDFTSFIAGTVNDRPINPDFLDDPTLDLTLREINFDPNIGQGNWLIRARTVHGACCDPGAVCAEVSECECLLIGGSYQGDQSLCTPGLCGGGTSGACCLGGGICSVETDVDCPALGGNYQGNGTSCAPNPCSGTCPPDFDWGIVDAGSAVPPACPPGSTSLVFLARLQAAMAYHAGSGQTVLVGGEIAGIQIDDDTTLFDGTNWSSMIGGAPSRSASSMVYDSDRDVLVLTGGRRIATNTYPGDMQEFDGSAWTSVPAGAGGPIVAGQGIAYDSDRKVIVLAGGFQGLFTMPGTHEFDPQQGTWTTIDAFFPVGAMTNSMVYDAARQVTFHFDRNGQSWTWDGSTWQLVASGGPAPRILATLVYDSTRQVVVLFGGLTTTGGSVIIGDTWEWDGLTWRQVNIAGPPPERYQHVAAFHASRNQMVMGGGLGPSGSFDCASYLWAYPEPVTTGTYCINGNGTGLDWSWSVERSSAWELSNLVALGTTGPPESIASRFVDDINVTDCNGLPAAVDAVVLPNAPHCFQVVAADNSAQLCVGQSGVQPGCCMPFDPTPADLCTGSAVATCPCSFNPQIASIVLTTEDCNANGVDDAIDIFSGVSADNNANGILDVCELQTPTLAGPPHDILKNRYISIDPRGANGMNVGKDFDIRLTLTNTLVSGVTAIGSQWWANAPDADCISVVGPTRPAVPPNWGACPTLHLTGCPIIPTATYDIVAMDGSTTSDPALAAATQLLPVDSKWWGDAVGSFTGIEWTPPQGVTNFDDVNASLKTFIDPGAVNATHTSVTDIHPNRPDLGGNSVHPNRLVSIDDVFQFIQAFQGAEYPGAAIDLCPDP